MTHVSINRSESGTYHFSLPKGWKNHDIRCSVGNVSTMVAGEDKALDGTPILNVVIPRARRTSLSFNAPGYFAVVDGLEEDLNVHQRGEGQSPQLRVEGTATDRRRTSVGCVYIVHDVAETTDQLGLITIADLDITDQLFIRNGYSDPRRASRSLVTMRGTNVQGLSWEIDNAFAESVEASKEYARKIEDGLPIIPNVPMLG